ncbi:hypothetical protein D3C86_2006400 [compost metagenome]
MLDDEPVEQAEIAGVHWHRELRDAVNEAIEDLSPPQQEKILCALATHAIDDLVAVLPMTKEFKDELRWILEIRIDLNGRIPARI